MGWGWDGIPTHNINTSTPMQEWSQQTAPEATTISPALGPTGIREWGNVKCDKASAAIYTYSVVKLSGREKKD